MKISRIISILLATALVIISLAACQPEKSSQAESDAQTEATTAAEETNIYDMENYKSSEVFDILKVNQGGKYDEIRPTYHHVETCQQTVPEAITAFLDGLDFEDVIRTAVSLGGDCDTLTCIVGGIAEAYYGIPDELRTECIDRLPQSMMVRLLQFESRRKST